ncbi:hypothetical protein [Halioxenophilus sp. WMMB6]|nr:hypothetical protein [Halioxenophilus sp. WMMB6]
MNLVASAILVVTAVVKKHHSKVLTFNLAVLIATALGVYHVLPNMPDA